jgi:hypothetical protein
MSPWAVGSVLLFVVPAVLAQYPQAKVPEWTIGSVPSLEIGDERSTHTQFDGVSGVLRMPGGEIVVANSRSQELRLFSASGKYLRTLSATGVDGQQRDLGRIWRSGDTIVAAEELPAESSVYLYRASGFLDKRQVGSGNAGGIRPLDRFPDGRFVITAARRSGGAIRVVDNVFRDSMPLGVMSLADRANPRWIGTLVSDVYIYRGIGGRGRVVTPSPYPLGRSTKYAVSGDRLWVGDTETGAITQYDSQGHKVSEFVAPIARRPLDTALVLGLRSSLLSDAMNWNDRARIDAAYSFPIPPFAPRFSRLLPGPNGEMWIETFQENPAAQRRFVVLGRDGKAIGSAAMPPTIVPYEIGADYVLGVRKDEEGLEHIVQYDLRRR